VTLHQRTKILIALTGLAPASMVITRLEIAAAVRKAKEGGGFGAWVDPGPLSCLFLFRGLAAFVASMISLFLDLRRGSS
jgi:hypothetical protein